MFSFSSNRNRLSSSHIDYSLYPRYPLYRHGGSNQEEENDNDKDKKGGNRRGDNSRKRKCYDEYHNDWSDDVFSPFIFSRGNEIHFTAEICDETINQLIREFQKIIRNHYDHSNPMYLDREDASQPVITLFISSYGGNLDATFRWLDYIDLLKQTGKIRALITVLTGFSASAATLMAQQGDVRMMTSNGYAMIHELLSGYYGSFSKLKSEVKFCEQLESKIVTMFMKKTGLPEDQIVSFLLRDTWFSAEEYLQYKFIDDIFDFEKMKLRVESMNEEEEEEEEEKDKEKEENKDEEDQNGGGEEEKKEIQNQDSRPLPPSSCSSSEKGDHTTKQNIKKQFLQSYFHPHPHSNTRSSSGPAPKRRKLY